MAKSKKVDPAKRAIDSIGKPKERRALDADKKLAKMGPEELFLRKEAMKHYKPDPTNIVRGGE